MSNKQIGGDWKAYVLAYLYTPRIQLNLNKNVIVNNSLLSQEISEDSICQKNEDKSQSTDLKSIYIERSSVQCSCLSGVFK